ncbi:hypothetical protein [Sinorhizobium alkalisoli]|uniref:Uncharacterized protein n=1 Tax=Sinorhizobium alkalisoli TaxID=1752398 RepID=A0A1E3VI68_9HYPH|nr:hypothetical protein [Sinorhizobium alkalisoli]ODR93290.1 hypothetical protein A8M32_00540 [Sinorhizobium alkalisoli]QFI70640.1 hypothetical protein EKH55_5766 [Sinorhizobium alkalisoli]
MPDQRKDNAEETLSAFAVEPSHDKATLDFYLKQHPELANELIDLSLELEMADPTEEDVFDTDSAIVNTAWAAFIAGGATYAPITAASFTREVAHSLGIKSSALMGLRDKKVEIQSLPIAFSTRLSRALATSVERLVEYLAGPQAMPVGASFKSDAKPEQKSKISIEQLLAECGHTPEQIANILRED